MAAKIDMARLKRNLSTLVKANVYDSEIHGPVVCPDTRCSCDLQGVKASSRNITKDDGKTEQIDVDAFFRLPKNADKNNKGHAPRCRYNIDKTVTRLVATSREIKKFDPGADPILATRGGVAEYRLHILMEALDISGYANGFKFPPTDFRLAKAFKGTQYIRTQKVLRPYFRVARAVNSLVSRTKGDETLSQFIRLRYGAESITWKDYFYDIDEHGRLYQYLQHNNQYARRYGTALDKPVAFAVRMITEWAPFKTKHSNWRMYCKGSLVGFADSSKAFINPVIYTKHDHLKNAIMSSDINLVCAIPTIEAPALEPFFGQSGVTYPQLSNQALASAGVMASTAAGIS